MRNLFLKHRWLLLLLGAALIALGVVGLVFVLKDNDVFKVTKAICVVVAIFLFISAAFLLLGGFLNVRATKAVAGASLFTSAGVSIGVGIALLFEEVVVMISGLIIYLLPLVLIGLGGAALLLCLILLFSEETRPNTSTWATYLIGGTVDLTIGIVLFINRDTDLAFKWIYGVISVLVILLGLFVVVLGFVSLGKKKADTIVVDELEVKEDKPEEVK